MKAPPGPFQREFWRSPLRGPWLTSVLGLVLLVGLTVEFVTGLLSYAAYNPNVGDGSNDTTSGKGLLGFYLFDWPTDPSWLYQLTQGLHVYVGLALVPVLLAKLWSVLPRFFAWPPVRSVAQALERLSLLLLVGGGFFVFATGILNIQYMYIFPVGFYASHFYGSWVFIAAMVLHVAVKTPVLLDVWRRRTLTKPDAPDSHDQSTNPDSLVTPNPAEPSMTRRGLLGIVGGGSLLLLAVSVGQSIGGPLRRLAVLAPRGGAEDFPVNKTAESRGIVPADTGPDWRLELHGERTIRLSRADLLAMPQYTERLVLACVEGWSTTQTWTGVRLRDLAERTGSAMSESVLVESLQKRGGFRAVNLARNQIADPRSLLALQVNGADLPLDHGYPARIIVPNNPGVHNTKWVSRMTFRA